MKTILFCLASIFFSSKVSAQSLQKKIIAFFTAKNDLAHISFVHEANRWFDSVSTVLGYHYDSTKDWTRLNDTELDNYKLVIFLDTRPEDSLQRLSFQHYMERGGAWMGFHFSAFALTSSAYPQNWDWYHNNFLGTGEYKGNTWRPTAAILKRGDKVHAINANMPTTFKSSPNEWYSWHNDLRQNPDISILFSIDASSFPLGTGPKQHEIWHEGFYPVVWTNKSYKMIYLNMGHNDMDYEHGTNETLSYTFGNQIQDSLIVNSLKWLMEEVP